MSRSVAGRSFDDARRWVAELQLADPAVGPPLDLALPRRQGLDGTEVRRTTGAGARRRTAVGPPVGVPEPLVTEGLPTLTEAMAGIAKGEQTARGLLEAALAAADRHRALGAVVHLDEAAARREADALDAEAAAGRFRGRLHGVPLTVKDVIHVTGMPTRAGSAAHEALDPLEGRAVAALRSAGALLVGKVATHEFALGVTTPQCRNPYDRRMIAGGSSGGSAIAVATGIGLGSLGTDTRASLRVPTALCGVVGFKPTFGSVPTDGIVPLSWTMDHLGPIARTVDDAAALLEVLQGRSLADAGAGVTHGRLVAGVPPGVLEAADPDVAAAVEAACGVLSGLGVEVVGVGGPSPEDLELANALGLLISRCEAATYHRAVGTELDRCIPEVRDQLTEATAVPAVDYLDAQRHRSVLAARTVAALGEVDLLVLPTTPVAAPPVDDYENYLVVLSRNAIIWSLCGCPALSMPCGSTSAGLPVGLQLVAAPGRDALVAHIGAVLEAALRAR